MVYASQIHVLMAGVLISPDLTSVCATENGLEHTAIYP